MKIKREKMRKIREMLKSMVPTVVEEVAEERRLR